MFNHVRPALTPPRLNYNPQHSQPPAAHPPARLFTAARRIPAPAAPLAVRTVHPQRNSPPASAGHPVSVGHPEPRRAPILHPELPLVRPAHPVPTQAFHPRQAVPATPPRTARNVIAAHPPRAIQKPAIPKPASSEASSSEATHPCLLVLCRIRSLPLPRLSTLPKPAIRPQQAHSPLPPRPVPHPAPQHVAASSAPRPQHVAAPHKDVRPRNEDVRPRVIQPRPAPVPQHRCSTQVAAVLSSRSPQQPRPQQPRPQQPRPQQPRPQNRPPPSPPPVPNAHPAHASSAPPPKQSRPQPASKPSPSAGKDDNNRQSNQKK